MTFGPVVAGTSLPEDEVVGAENLAVGSGANGVHGAGLEIHQNRAGDVAAAGGFVEVHVDALELEIGVSLVGSGGIDAVLITDDFPELGTNLVTALATLDGNDFTHTAVEVVGVAINITQEENGLEVKKVKETHKVLCISKTNVLLTIASFLFLSTTTDFSFCRSNYFAIWICKCFLRWKYIALICFFAEKDKEN